MLYEIDRAVFYLINNSMHWGVLDPLMVFVTRRPYVFFSIALLVLAPKYRSRLVVPLVLSLIAWGLSDLTGNFFKHLFERQRPFEVLDHVNKLVSAGSFAFPSNHAANAFAVATGIAWFFRKAALPFLLLALIVALSRVYVGVHYPSDVIAGGVLGVAISFIVLFLYNRAKNFRK
jgi:undecaprenyl-diphosphatase